MGGLSKLYEKVISGVFIYYIKLVYKTSRVTSVGAVDLIKDSSNDEKMVLFFWHGDSYCFYPFLQGEKLSIITTKDRRGDFITSMCKHFGYDTLRLPDKSKNGRYIFKVRRAINEGTKSHLAMAIDGPLGPYHVPKDLPFMTALFAKRRILLITVKVARKIEITKRWDKFKIPIPFNRIDIQISEPLSVASEDRKDNFINLKDKVKRMMEEVS